jgi:hypothetical protein
MLLCPRGWKNHGRRVCLQGRQRSHPTADQSSFAVATHRHAAIATSVRSLAFEAIMDGGIHFRARSSNSVSAPDVSVTFSAILGIQGRIKLALRVLVGRAWGVIGL